MITLYSDEDNDSYYIYGGERNFPYGRLLTWLFREMGIYIFADVGVERSVHLDFGWHVLGLVHKLQDVNLSYD